VIGATRTVVSGRLSRLVGDEVARFEQEAGEYLAVAAPVSVASATLGLDLILADVGVGPGDEVVVPGYCWMTVPGAIARRGANIAVSNVDQALHSSSSAIAEALTGRTKAVVVVHMRGVPASDTAEIVRDCRARGIVVIEDCAQAWGARLDDRHVGTLGDYAFYSLQQYKSIAVGEGGLVHVRDAARARRVRWSAGDLAVEGHEAVWPGNARLTEVQAALARAQLRAFPRTLARLRAIAHAMATGIAVSSRAGSVHAPPANALASGISVPVWFPSHTAAAHAHAALAGHRIRAFLPSAQGDRHTVRGWPRTGGVEQLTSDPVAGLDRCVDIPVPLVGRGRAHRFVRRLQSAAERWDHP
jgi:perosamine synthetase